MAHPEVVFQYDPRDEKTYLETVRSRGVAVLHGYMPQAQVDDLAEEILAQPFRDVDEVHGSVHEQYALREWKAADARGRLGGVVARVGNMVQTQGIPWNPTDVRGQLYQPDRAGVDWHVDFKRSLYVVGVLGVVGTALFEAEVEGTVVSEKVGEGGLVIIRNTGLNPGVDDRLRHRVFPPETGQRLSLGIRQE